MAVSEAPGPDSMKDACGEVYRTHYGVAFKAAHGVLNSTAEAEDIVQDAFMKVFARVESGRPPSNMQAYIAAMCRDMARRRLSRRQRETALEETVVSGQFPVEDAALASSSLAWRALQSVREDWRTAVVLHEWEGMTEAEVGRAMGRSRNSAQKLIRRGLAAMLATVVALIAERREQPAACKPMTPLLWRSLLGVISVDERGQLDQHLAHGCSYCPETLEQLKQAKGFFGISLLFPLTNVAAKQQAAIDRYFNRPRAGGMGRPWAAQALSAAALLLLILGSGISPDAPSTPPSSQPTTIGAETVAATVSASPEPSPVALPSPSPTATPAPSPSTTPTLAPTPTPVPVVVSACPAGPTGSYAYLSAGNLFYRSALGAPAQKLDPAGPVTDYWWNPNGGSVAYKVTNGSTFWGDIRIVDLASGRMTWDLGRQVTYFNFSPDGQSWVASYPVYTNGSQSANHVIVGAVGQPAAAAHEFDISGDNTPLNSTDQLDSPSFPRHAANGYDGLYWLSEGIYLSTGGGTNAQVRQFSPTGNQSGPYTPASPALLARFDNQPATSALSLVSSGTELNLSCAGRSTQLTPANGPGRPEVLTVSRDGLTALVTFVTQSGLNLFRVTADGQLQALSSDGATSLAHWRPGS